MLIMLTQKLKLSLCVLLLSVMAGCAGKYINNTSAPQRKGMDIPDSIVRAFEVKENVDEQALKADLEAQRKTEKQKKSKKKKEEKKQDTPKVDVNSKEQIENHILDGRLEIPNRRPEFDPIWVGEKITMDVTWLKTTAGEFHMEVLPFKYVKNRKVYHIRGLAQTSKIFSMIYKAEDYVETFVDYMGWFPYKFTLNGDESRHIRRNVELYDHTEGKQYIYLYDLKTLKNEVDEENKVKDLTKFSQDALSALYYVRTQKIEVGSRVRFPMTTNGDQWETEVIILKKEDLKTPMGTRPALKAKVETRFNGALKQEGESHIWFSDDPRHFVLRFEAKVKIGWVSGITKAIESGSPQ